MKKVKIDNFFGDDTSIFEDIVDKPKKGVAVYEIEEEKFDRLVQICQKYQISYSLSESNEKAAVVESNTESNEKENEKKSSNVKKTKNK